MLTIRPYNTTSIPQSFKGYRRPDLYTIYSSDKDTQKNYFDTYKSILEEDFVDNPDVFTLVRKTFNGIGKLLFNKEVIEDAEEIRHKLDKIA